GESGIYLSPAGAEGAEAVHIPLREPLNTGTDALSDALPTSPDASPGTVVTADSTVADTVFRFETVTGWPASFEAEADRLAGLSRSERARELSAMSQPQRETLASNHPFVEQLSRRLDDRVEEFAEAAS